MKPKKDLIYHNQSEVLTKSEQLEALSILKQDIKENWYD